MKKKLGFSITELLIALAIISIIAVMATNITKRGVENAYNAYFYTGYKALYEAINEAVSDDEKPAGAMHRPPSKSFVQSIADSFDAETEDYCNDTNTTENRIDITGTSNGIVYSFKWLAQTSDSEFYDIYMFVPGVRKKSGTNVIVGKTVRFIYAPDLNSGVLIPAEIDSTDTVLRPRAFNGQGGLAANETTSTDINLQLRKDLLPFYIEDGKAGHVVFHYDISTDANGNTTYSLNTTPADFVPRTFMTYREAYCKMYGGLTIGERAYVDCASPTSVAQDAEPTGILSFENPRKVF